MTVANVVGRVPIRGGEGLKLDYDAYSPYVMVSTPAGPVAAKVVRYDRGQAVIEDIEI